MKKIYILVLSFLMFLLPIKTFAATVITTDFQDTATSTNTVTISISLPSGTTLKTINVLNNITNEVLLSLGEGADNTQTVTFTKNGTYTINVIDSNGTRYQKVLTVKNLTVGKPKITTNFVNYSAYSIKTRLKITTSDSVVKSILIKNAKGTVIFKKGYKAAKTQYFTITKNGTYTITVIDAKNRKTVKKIKATGISSKNPIISTNYKSKTCQTQKISVNISTYGNSSLKYIKVLDSAGELKYLKTFNVSKSFSFTANKSTVYRIIAIDKNGRKSTYRLYTFKIDGIAPTITTNFTDTAAEYYSITATITEKNGLKLFKVVNPNGVIIVNKTKNISKKQTFKMTINGVYTITCTDSLGNKRVKTLKATNIGNEKATNSNIWMYFNDTRVLIPTKYGYACFGQNSDNKNILFVPLKFFAELFNSKVSGLTKTGTGSTTQISATVSGAHSFQVVLGSDEINGKKVDSPAFILKGTNASITNTIMVPLSFILEEFNLKSSVLKPTGTGVKKYCSLELHFTTTTESVNLVNTSAIVVPNSLGTTSSSDLTNANKTKTVYVVSGSDYYHLTTTCSELSGKTYSTMTEYEAIYWGYIPCSECIKETD